MCEGCVCVRGVCVCEGQRGSVVTPSVNKKESSAEMVLNGSEADSMKWKQN